MQKVKGIYRYILTAIVIYSITIFLFEGLKDDGIVHFNRIQCIANNIQTQGFIGAMQQKIYYSAIDNMGYAFPTFYGDILLYPFAILQILLSNYINTYWIIGLYFQVMSVLAIVQFRYYIGKIYNIDGVKLISLIYILMPYFQYFSIRQTTGEVVAWALYPMIFYGFSRILNMKENEMFDAKAYITLVQQLVILLLSHLIQAYIVIWALVIWSVYRFKIILKLNRIITLAISALTTCLITSYYIFPMLEQINKNYIVLNYTNNDLYNPIQLSLGSLFLPSWIFTILEVTTGFNVEIISGNGFSPAYFGLMLVVAYKIITVNKENKLDKFKYTIFIIGVLFIQSHLVRIIQPIFEKIQFPFRFLGLLSFIILVFILKNWNGIDDKHIRLMINVLLLSVQLVALENNIVYQKYTDIIGNTDIQLQIGSGCEYLPYIEDYTKRGIVSFRDQYNINELLRNIGNSKASEIDTEIIKGGYSVKGLNEIERNTKQILLPITYNPNYSAFDKDGKEYHIKLGSYGLVEVTDVESDINNLNIIYTYQDIEIYSTILQIVTLGLFLGYIGISTLKLENKNFER